MKNLFIKLTILISFIIIFNSCKQKNDMNKILTEVDLLKEKFAPDKRVAIFNITTNLEGNTIQISGETDNREAITQLVKRIKKLGYEVNNKVNLLPDNDLGIKTYGIINLSVANIRSEPRHPAELATQAMLGTCVNVLKEKNGWYLIQTPDKYISWVDDDGIALVTKEELIVWKNAEKVIVTNDFSSVYYSADDKSAKLSDVVKGNILKLLNSRSGFSNIEFPDGRIGFIKSSEVKIYKNWSEGTVASKENILSSAQEFMGLPYLWGGTSIKGVDCSGFTKTVYFLNGVILPRDASQQVNVGELVETNDSFENLVPGDLLFFGTKGNENKKERITHVAIYIGEGQYIHSSGRVRINSFNKESIDFNKYRYNTFIRAKRIIGNYDTGENLIKNNSFYN